MCFFFVSNSLNTKSFTLTAKSLVGGRLLVSLAKCWALKVSFKSKIICWRSFACSACKTLNTESFTIRGKLLVEGRWIALLAKRLKLKHLLWETIYLLKDVWCLLRSREEEGERKLRNKDLFIEKCLLAKSWKLNLGAVPIENFRPVFEAQSILALKSSFNLVKSLSLPYTFFSKDTSRHHSICQNIWPYLGVVLKTF